MIVLIYTCFLFIFLFSLVYLISIRKFNYWKKKKVPHLKPSPFLGNYGKYILQKEYLGQLVQRICNKFPNEPYIGAYFGTEPALIVKDPELINEILVKEHPLFNGREISKHEKKELINENLIFASGNRWKILRHNLNPLFTSAKMKNMFHLILKCAYDLEDVLKQENEVIETKHLMARFTMDCIGSCAFGIDTNTMINTKNNPFIYIASELVTSTTFCGFKLVFRSIWPTIFYGLGFTYIVRSVDKFFNDMMNNVFKSRNYKPSTRNDFVDLLLTFKDKDYITSTPLNTEHNKDLIFLKVDDGMLTAQCTVFFAAGFETSASMLSFTLYELAKYPEVQEKAAKEVDEYLYRNKNKLYYECVQELQYLEACLHETMRMYPVLGVLSREAMDDVTLPTGLHLDKGVRIHIPIYYLHYNPDYYPEPEKYKPERFLHENRKDLKPHTYFPYGGGPRLCIGQRFSKMQVMAGLVSFLKMYRVELAEGTPETVTLESRSFVIQPKENNLPLKIFKRDGWENRCFDRN